MKPPPRVALWTICLYQLAGCADASKLPPNDAAATPGVATGGKAGASGSGFQPQPPQGNGAGLAAGGSNASGAGGGFEPQPPQGNGCGLSNLAFCDSFDSPSPGGNAGDLDDALWSVARIQGAGWGEYNPVRATTVEGCGKEVVAGPGGDLSLCEVAPGDGRLNMSYYGGDAFIVQSLRIRQPFDFADRTGIISFDVDGESRMPGGHGFWFNVMIADEPVPAPYQEGGGIALFVHAGVGIEFKATPAPCGQFGEAGGVSLFFVQKDFAITSSYHPPDSDVECFTTAPEQLNHIEIHVSTSSIEVFASDAGKPETLRRVAHAEGLDLPLTRGYVSLQQAHYSSRKFTWTNPACQQVCCSPDTIDDPECRCEGQESTTPCVSSVPHCAEECPVLPGYHTYHWDNVAFDGPVFKTPRVYQVPDATVMDAKGHYNTGWLLHGKFQEEQGRTPLGMQASDGVRADPISLEGVDLTGAFSANLTFNAWFFAYESGDKVGYRINGGPFRDYSPPWSTESGLARALSIPVELSDLSNGTNTLEMRSGTGIVSIANLELVVNVN
ncbi:MAG TPA: hypothetical protein VJN18_10735 [Polyangiaceae bacterium]|nr:hypothetical protein [Polyangiaceae bacterium]